jgi:hypothetical protein
MCGPLSVEWNPGYESRSENQKSKRGEWYMGNAPEKELEKEI